MITDSFDNESKAIIDPIYNENRYKIDTCIITFSHKIDEYALSNYNNEKIGELKFVTANVPVYQLKYKDNTFVFFKTFVGSPATVGAIEDLTEIVDIKKIIAFGSAGSLNKNISNGKIIIPTYAYRDEGTSYHYVEPSDYIRIKNSDIVSNFMKENNIPYIEGRTWTTDAFFRETINNFNKRKKEGCLSVEMECSAVQALCDYRNLELYYFLTSGDLLDAEVYNSAYLDNANHDNIYFDIALNLGAKVKTLGK